MTKGEFIKEVSIKVGMSQKSFKEIFEVIEESIIDSVKTNDELTLGFGKFTGVNKAETKARNPKTGDAIIVEPKRVVRFKPNKAFKDGIN